MNIMDRILGIVFGMATLFDLHSSEPAIAEMKRARLVAVLCIVAALVFFGVAFATQPDPSSASSSGVRAMAAEFEL